MAYVNKNYKVFFNASTISLLIFWVVQMLLYISIYFFTNICEGDNDSNNVMYELLILSIITFGYLGWFNLLFLWFLYSVKINRAWVMSYRICFVESFLFWTIFYIIRLVIDNLPHNIKFYYTQPKFENGITISNTAYTICPYFSDSAQLLYVYIILFFIALLSKLYIAKRTNCIF